MIYNTILIEPFKKMVQSILRKYPIHIGNYEIEEVEENVLTHLIENMVKFNPDKITKSGKKTKQLLHLLLPRLKHRTDNEPLNIYGNMQS